MKLLKTAIILAAEFFAFSILLLNIGHSYEYKHFGAPPKGMSLYTLKTSPKLSTFQIVGSLRPMQLIINGKLTPLENSSHYKNGIFLNDTSIKTMGKNGTFFYEHTQKEKKDFLIIYLGYKNTYKQARIPLSSLNLDYPIEESIYVKQGEKVIFPQFNSLLKEVKADLIKEFKPGSYIFAKEFNTRIINLPYQVTKDLYNKSKLILGIDPTPLKKLKITGSIIHGITTPTSKVWINNQRIPIDPDGKFRFKWLPQQEQEFIIVKTQLKNQNLKQSFQTLCPDFKKGHPWYLPAAPDKFVEFALMEENWTTNSELERDDVRGIAHKKLRFSYPINFNSRLGFQFLEAYNDYDTKRSLQVNSDHSFFYRHIYHQDFGWFYGGDIIFRNILYKKAGNNCNFCENLEQNSLAAQVFAGRRFSLPWDFEWTPQIFFKQALTGSLFVTGFHFEMLSFRKNF